VSPGDGATGSVSFGETTPYAFAALRYLELGWPPLPVTGKGKGRGNGPPAGFTGRNGQDPSPEVVAYWAESRAALNVALRLPDGVCGVDVDAYGEKRGAETLLSLEAARGKLPPTWVVTSRLDGVSGIRMYKVPSGWDAPSALGPGIEVISHGYRYAVAWPSVHPDTGLQYKWHRELEGGGRQECEPPRASELPELPAEWLSGWPKFASGMRDTAGGGREGDGVSIDAMIRDGAGPSGGQRQALLALTMKLAGMGRSEAEAKVVWDAVIAATTDTDPAAPWSDDYFEEFFSTAQAKAEGSEQPEPPPAALVKWARGASAVATASEESGGGSGDAGGGDRGGGDGGAEGEEGGGDANDYSLIALLAGDERWRLPEQSLSGDAFYLGRGGVARRWADSRDREHLERIALQPFLPARLLQDDRGEAYVELAWLSLDGSVRRAEVAWAVVADHRRLPGAFDGDAVIIGRHASACAEYIQECLGENRALLAETKQVIVTALGWPADTLDSSVFTFGDGRPHRVIDVKNTGDWLAGHRKSGTLDAWKDAMQRLADRKHVHVLVAAALAAPLLRFTGRASFIVDLSHGSSTGKSKALELAAAVWGDPALIMQSWKATGVAIEHHLAMSRGMPMFTDETQLAADAAQIEAVVYGLTQGKSKSRSRQAGDQLITAVRWESIVLTTGEKPITSFTQKGGVIPRVVTLAGQAMPSREAADFTSRVARENYGHAGEAFLAMIQELGRSRVAARCDAVEELLAALAQSPVAGRRAASIAVLAVAHEAGVTAGLLPPAPDGTWEWLAGGGDAVPDDDDDKPRKALSEVLTWAMANRHRFTGSPGCSVQLQESLGCWAVGRSQPFISFVPASLSEKLEKLGYDSMSVRLAWRDRGWIATSGGKTAVVVHIQPGEKAKHVKIMMIDDIIHCDELPDGEDWVTSWSPQEWAKNQASQ
jgi:Domain of unknown function (DUF927)/Bifunctional DNA primase/polymerase, N-terminal